MTTQPSNSISDERNFRPKTLEDFIGQGDLKKTLRLMLNSAHQRSATLEHVVFYGGPGLGKTTLAAIIAAEAGPPVPRTGRTIHPEAGRPGKRARQGQPERRGVPGRDPCSPFPLFQNIPKHRLFGKNNPFLPRFSRNNSGPPPIYRGIFYFFISDPPACLIGEELIGRGWLVIGVVG